MSNDIESVILQDYVSELTVSPHIGDSGILGLGEGLSLLATFLVCVFILYIIGGFRHKKRFGEWLKPDRCYFKGIARGFTAFFATFMGVPIPKAFVDSSDGEYAILTKAEIRQCIDYAYDAMGKNDISYSIAYKWREFDCEDFAGALKYYATSYYSTFLGQKNKGAPFALFGYTRADGQKHVCIKAVADKKPIFFEVYPDHAGELKLTTKEIKSMDLELF